MYTIEIDFDVFKEITARRTSEGVKPNDVIREALGLGPGPKGQATPSAGERPWTPKGVVFPHGTEFRATYKGETILGQVDDGALVVNGKRYSSPSAPAVDIAGGSAVNGWRFWECRRTGETGWTLIDSLRNG